MLIAGTGLCVQFGAPMYYLLESDFDYTPTGVVRDSWIIYAAGTALMVWGLTINAKGKWQSPLLGFLGVFSFLGAIIVAAQPDLHKAAKRERLINKKVEDLPEQDAVEFFCRNCDYQLNGITGQACPECGNWFNPDDLNTVLVAGTGLDEAPWMGRWSLLCGIMGVLLGVGPPCGPLLSITGIAFGHSALYQIKHNHLKGFGVALAGLITSYFALALSAALIYVIFLL